MQDKSGRDGSRRSNILNLLSPNGGLVAQYIGAIDQGTTSTRFVLFDASG